MTDLEDKLVKLCDGIRALVDWEAELQEAGETDRAGNVRNHLVQMIEFAARMQAGTPGGLAAKRDSLAAIVSAGQDIDASAAVRALRASIEADGKRLSVERNSWLN